LSEYCEKYFELQDRTDSGSGEERTVSVHTAGPYVEPPNDVDIEIAIKKLQNWKATVHNQIPAKLFKEGGKSSRKSFFKSFKKCWRKRSYHTRGNVAKYVQLIKKWDVMKCDNFRAFTFLCTTYTILENILYIKLVPYVEEIKGEYRGDFRREYQLLTKYLLRDK